MLIEKGFLHFYNKCVFCVMDILKMCEKYVKNNRINIETARIFNYNGYNRKTEEKRMKYVILVSHGEFAPGLHSAVKMMTGDRDDVLSTSLKDGMSADEFAENFKELVKDIQADDEIILLADILSGSPFTNALNVLSEKGMLAQTLVIAGMNMPLAITAVLMKDNFDDKDALAETLLNEGRTGLTRFETDDAGDDDDDI